MESLTAKEDSSFEREDLDEDAQVPIEPGRIY